MKAILAALALALSLPVLAPRAVAQSTEPLDRIVAVVDDDVVLQSELDRQVRALTTQYANNPQQLPPRDVLERQLLDRLILQKLQVARADSTGVKVSDAEVDQALTSIARNNNMDVSQMRGAIQQQGMNYDQFRHNVHDQLVVQRLRQRVAQSRVQISDAEIDSLLRNGKLGGQMHLGYIMIGVPDGATPEQIDTAHGKAEEARRQIEGGLDFGAAAIRYSNAENALQGGDLGWRSRNELPPAFVDAAEHLADGAISTPLRGPNGFYLVKRFGQREGAGEHVVTEYQARHILIKTSELMSSAQAQAKVAAIRQQIVDGEDFAKAAKASSQDEPTAQLGGELGWFSGDAYGPKILQEVESLKAGEISQPFETNVGWHIVQLVDTRQTDKAGEMQRDEAKNILFQRKAEDEYESFLRQMRSEAYVEIRLPGAAATAGKPGAP